MKKKHIIFALFSITVIFFSCTGKLAPVKVLPNQLPSEFKKTAQSTDNSSTKNANKTLNLSVREEINLLRQAYPYATFSYKYDKKRADYEITLSIPNFEDEQISKTVVLFWQNGKYLTKKQAETPDAYTKIFSPFPKKAIDPSTFTEESIQRIQEFSTSTSRKDAPIRSSALYDAFYDSASQIQIEQHLQRIKFLGKRINVHERIASILKNLEADILALSKEDSPEGKEVDAFLKNIGSIECYSWRKIRTAQSRSMHSHAIAVDILPQKNKKAIYWNWERVAGNDDWFLIPLEKRWSPPSCIIALFEQYGFCWGGKWAIWDNMHFEYRPEHLLLRDKKQPFSTT